MSITAGKRDAYSRAIEDLVQEALDLGTAGSARAGEYVVEALEEVQQIVARYSPDQWSRGAYQNLEREIRRALDEMGEQLVDHALDGLDQAATLAGDGVLRAALDTEVLTAEIVGGWPAVDAKLVNIASGFTTDLLVNLRDEIKTEIGGYVRRAVVSARPQVEVVRDIEATLAREGADLFHFGSYFERAMVQYDTETGRLYNSVQYTRGLELDSVYPGSRKWWWYSGVNTRAEHEECGRQTERAPIPIRDPFVLRVDGGGTVRLWYPIDPGAQGSARDVKRMTINCHCRKVDVLPVTGADPLPVDPRAVNVVVERADYRELAQEAA